MSKPTQARVAMIDLHRFIMATPQKTRGVAMPLGRNDEYFFLKIKRALPTNGT